jgi:hypothetical protein
MVPMSTRVYASIWNALGCPYKKVLKHSAGIFKLLRSPGIDLKEQISLAYVTWRAGTTTLFLLVS